MNISLNSVSISRSVLCVGITTLLIVGGAVRSTGVQADAIAGNDNNTVNDTLILDRRQTLDATSSAAPEQSHAAAVAYAQLIADLERQQGAYGPDLTQQLLALGASLQRQARHEEAVEVFKRGAHLARINTGLYSADQIALLRGEINSHFALGDFAQVDERRAYLYRVERRALRHDNGASTQALLDQALWERQAYVMGIDDAEARFARLQSMWRLNRLALDEVIKAEGDTSPALLAPLYGMLQSQYFIAGYQGFDEVLAGMSYDNRHLAHNSVAYRQGRSVLEAIMLINASNSDDDMAVRARDLVQLGDWAWWFNDRSAAVERYQQAYDAIAQSADPEALNAALFGAPTPIPDIDGIRPLPAYNANADGPLTIRFAIGETGRMTDLTKVQVPDSVPEDAAISSDRLLRHLRKIRFRPRLDAGETIPRTDIVWSFDPQNWRTQTVAMAQ